MPGKYVRASQIRRRGETAPPNYTRWEQMKQRCYNPSKPEYKWYGARGITVCDRWLGKDGYLNYAADVEALGPQPSPKHTIDRINNDGNYEPGNIRWATQSEQIFNSRPRPNKTSGHKGISWSKAVQKWHAYMHVEGKRQHLGYFDELEDAIDTYERTEQYYKDWF